MPISLSVIGGYLGAGKTTLINHLLRHAQGRRITVFVNDFGSTNLDADLIAARHGNTLALANGCACCAVGGDLMNALLALDAAAQRDPASAPEHLIIEASGVADPWKIAQIGLVAAVSSAAPNRLQLDAVIVLADALNLATQLADPYIGESVARQFARADLVVVSKADCVSPEALAACDASVRTLAPTAAIVHAERGNVPLDVLLNSRHTASTRSLLDGLLNGMQAEQPHPDYVSASWLREEPIPKPLFEAALRALPAGVVRGKGVLWFAGEATATEWHRVGGRDTFAPLVRITTSADRTSRWVIITVNTNQITLSTAFNAL